MPEPVTSQGPDTDAAPLALITRLRAHRVRPGRTVSLTETVGLEREAISRLRRKLGSAGAAWGRVCPPAMRDRTVPGAYRGGVLTVMVPDASTRYRVDKWLRSGGLRAMQQASRSPLHRVQLTLERAPGEKGSD